MIDISSHTEDMFVDTDIFVVTEGYDNHHDFVTIDHDLSDAVMIDMSQDVFSDAVTIDFGIDSDSFVTVEDHVFVSDFTGDDSIDDFVGLDLADDINV